MKILEYGDLTKDKLILIHGFQMPLASLKVYIDTLKEEYCVVTPVLPGHDPETEEEFESFEKCLEEFEDYYINKHGNTAYAIIAFSMGGIFASYIWAHQKIRISKLILESSPLLKWQNFMTKMMTKEYLSLTQATRDRNEKIVNQAVNSIVREQDLEAFLTMMDHMSDKTIVRYLEEVGKYNLPTDIDTPDTEIYYFYGGKMSEILFKKVGKYISKNYANSHMECLKGKGHCEDAILHPEERVKDLAKTLKE